MHINNLLNIDMVCCVVLCRVGLCVADWHVLGDFECGLWSSQTGECMFISLFSPTFGFQIFFIFQIFPHLLSPLRRLFHSSIRFCPVWRLIWIRVRCEVFPDKWNVFWTSFFYLFEFYLYCSTSCFVGNYEKREWKQKEKNLNRMPSAVNTHSVIFYVSLFIKWSTSLDSFVKYK